MAPGVVIFNVHGIGPASRELEPGEDRTWVSVEQFEQVLDAVVDRPDARITFDDGNASDIEIGLPRLLERGLTAEFFVLAGKLDEPGRLTRADVKELVAAGMGIGSHGWTHRDWRRIDERQAVEEIIDSPRLLEDLTGRKVTTAAIPFGSYDRHVLARLRTASVTRVYTSDGGKANPNSWLQARNSLHHDLTPDWVRKVLDGSDSPRIRARRVVAKAVKRLRG